MLVMLDVKGLGRRIAELQQVEGSQIAGRIVEEQYSEHGLEATIGPDSGQVCQSLMVV